jgi:hypothetical protein
MHTASDTKNDCKHYWLFVGLQHMLTCVRWRGSSRLAATFQHTHHTIAPLQPSQGSLRQGVCWYTMGRYKLCGPAIVLPTYPAWSFGKKHSAEKGGCRHGPMQSALCFCLACVGSPSFIAALQSCIIPAHHRLPNWQGNAAHYGVGTHAPGRSGHSTGPLCMGHCACQITCSGAKPAPCTQPASTCKPLVHYTACTTQPSVAGLAWAPPHMRAYGLLACPCHMHTEGTRPHIPTSIIRLEDMGIGKAQWVDLTPCIHVVRVPPVAHPPTDPPSRPVSRAQCPMAPASASTTALLTPGTAPARASGGPRSQCAARGSTSPCRRRAAATCSPTT